MKIKAFTSDQHFGHEAIIRLSNRPFYSVEHMNKTIVERYNSVIGKDDTVIFVGDISYLKKNDYKKIMKELNGHKILVRGNHDKGTQSDFLEFGFDLIVDTFMMLEIENINIKVCHYPYPNMQTSWPDKHILKRPTPNKNEILIHGHTHNKEKRFENMIHVGVDAWDFTPALYDDIVSIVKEIKSDWESKNDNI